MVAFLGVWARHDSVSKRNPGVHLAPSRKKCACIHWERSKLSQQAPVWVWFPQIHPWGWGRINDQLGNLHFFYSVPLFLAAGKWILPEILQRNLTVGMWMLLECRAVLLWNLCIGANSCSILNILYMYMYLRTRGLLNHKLISSQTLKRILQKKKKWKHGYK